MPDFTDKPGYAFDPVPPPEASAFLANKGLRPSFHWRDVEPEEHAVAFTVAKAMQADLLEDIRQAVEAALDEGNTFAQFKRELRPVLEAKGWWGRREMVDPRTGEQMLAQLGSPRRLRTIYRANLRAARAAGQWERIERTKEALPYLQYRLGPSERHRPHHEAKEGLILPVDDPFWDAWMPPNGWGCKCWVRQLSPGQAERAGGVNASPDIPTVEVRNKRTGETRRVPEGIDVGWARNPGRLRERAARRVFEDKLEALSPEVARVALRDIATSWRVQRIARREVPGRAPIGVLPAGVAAAAGVVRSVSFTDQTARHLFEEKADRAVTDLDLAAWLDRARFALRVDLEGRRSLHAFVSSDDGRTGRLVLYFDEHGTYLATIHRWARRRAERRWRAATSGPEFTFLE